MVQVPNRVRLPQDRCGTTHRFKIGNLKGYLTVNEIVVDGKPMPGEFFICLAKSGGTLHAFADSTALLASMCLQHSVPLAKLCTKFIGWRFEPCGYVENGKDIHYVESILDYIFRWLALRYLGKAWLHEFEQAAAAQRATPFLSDEVDAET